MIPQVTIPEGQSGDWRVERFIISEADARFANIRASMKRGARYVQAGSYTRLMRGSTVVMSDTPAEMRDHTYAVRAAKNTVLINGLGIGMVLNACLIKPEVERVLVVEKSADVIALVAPHYRSLFGDRFEVVEADALSYTPPKKQRFGAVWHDIWDYICADNLPQMTTLHRRYGKRTDWQGSWCRELCQMYR